ncbi:MAG: flippase-like domain-containing protein [Chromatiales bacterium]|nr:flippase-like domain-containing protein [Chromatiales bacterium]
MEATGKKISLLIKLIVTGVIFYLVFNKVDIEGVFATMARVDLRFLLVAVGLQFLSTIVASYRWKLVMQRLAFGQNFVFYLRSYFKGSFFNQGLPTSIGGDAIRVIDVARTGHRKREAFYGVAVDRGLGLVGLLIFNLLANLFAPNLLPTEVYWVLNVLVIGGIVGFIVFYFLNRISWLEQRMVTRVLLRISQRLDIVLDSAAAILRHLPLALLIHLLSLLCIYTIGSGVGMEFDVLTYMVIVPPVILLTIVPISLAGWGVREGGMIGLFALLGADNTLVLSMSIIYGLILIVTALPGLVIYLLGKHHL